MSGRSAEDQALRPRVLVLGGGFAGVGAARKLKEADAEVVLVDEHDYHTFQPLLYQVATDLLEHVGGRASAARPLPRPAERRRPPDQGHGDRPRRAGGAVRRDGAARVRLPRAGARRRGQLLRGRRRAEHAFPMYTLADAVRLKEHVLRNVGGGGRDPASWTTAHSTSSSSAVGRRGWRAPARWPSSTAATSPRTTRACRRRRRASSLVEAGPELFSMFKREHPRLHGRRR